MPVANWARRGRIAPVHALMVLAAILVAATWLATYQRFRFETRQAIQSTVRANSNLAMAYEENARDAFETAEKLLNLLELEYTRHGHQHAADALDEWAFDRELLRGVGIAGTDGSVLAGTGELAAQDVSGLEAFTYHRDHAGADMRVGVPYRLPLQGPWRLAVSRRMQRADGTFSGVLMAIVDPAYFTNFYARADLGEKGLAMLLNGEGFALARQAGSHSGYAVDMRTSTLRRFDKGPAVGNYVSRGQLEGIVRLVSYRKLASYDLVVAIGTARSDTLAPVHERLRMYGLLAALITCMVGLAAAGLTRSINRLNEAVASLRQTQSRLAASEARTRAITESMAGGVITTGREGLIRGVNRAACEMFGYEARELVGRSLAMLIHPGRGPNLRAVLDDMARRTGDFRCDNREILTVRRDGSALEAEVMVSGMLIEGDWTYVGIVHDISQRKRVERALRASESRLRATFDQALVGIAHSDASRRFTRVNHALCEMLGYSKEELQQRTWLDVTHPDDIGASLQFEGTGTNEPGSAVPQIAKRFIRKNGTIVWTLLNVSTIRGEDGSPDYDVGMFLDITQLKQAERMKNEFISTVSHELRTPLTSINGSLGLMAAGIAGPLPPAAKELTTIAARNCERLIRLVSDILDVEKADAGKMTLHTQPIDACVLVRHALETNEGFASAHGVHLAFRDPGVTLGVNADADRFAQVMTNLLSNAVKFSPAGGTVDVVAARRESRVRIEVSDRGPGIPEEFRSRIFQRFSQAQTSDAARRGGSGLGLCIAKSIVERLGGTIGFEPRPGGGTTFHVELPLLPEAAADTRASQLQTMEA